MKLTYFQLEPHLAKTLSSVYIVSGEELLLKQEALQLIRQAAKKSGFEQKTRVTIESGFDWEQLYPLLYATSLLAEKRVLELDFKQSTPNKAGSQILSEYGKNPVNDNLLVIDLGKIDSKTAKSSWYQSLAKIATIITIWPMPVEKIPQWIIARAKKYKLSMTLEAAHLLSDYSQGNLMAAAQSLEKVYLLQPQIQIDRDLLTTILTDESRFSLFDFVESLIAGEVPNALRILDKLQAEGTEPILILWGIARELRLLSEWAEQIKQGLSFASLFQEQRIFSKRQTAIRHFLTKHSVEDCWNYLSHLTDIDQQLKGASLGNAWEALQLFCLRVIAKT